eukprot:763451-Hanusia_phi.AAC.4
MVPALPGRALSVRTEPGHRVGAGRVKLAAPGRILKTRLIESANLKSAASPALIIVNWVTPVPPGRGPGPGHAVGRRGPPARTSKT